MQQFNNENMKLKKYLYETAKYVLRSYPVIYPYIKEVEKLYAMSPEELNQRNEKRFLEIFHRAYDKSPFYRKLYTEAGIRKEDITSLTDIKKLPVVTKDMVKQHANEMLTVPKRKVRKGNTSGTTGTPLSVYSDWKSIWMVQAYLYCTRKRYGFTYGQRFVCLRGHLDKNNLSLKIHLSNTLFLSSYNINPANTQFYYDSIRKFKPRAIEGYPSSLYTLALLLSDAGLKLEIPVAFTSSETLLPYQREKIEQQFNTQIFDLYGMTERTISLMEAYNHQGYYEMPGFSINEYLEDGEICTSLINESFPMIRYKSNDVMEMMETTEDNPQIVVKHIEGRKADYLCCKDGSHIILLDFLFKGVKHVKMSQLVQTKDDTLEIYVVPEPDFEDVDKHQIEYNLMDRVGTGNIDFRIKLINEKDIRYTPRGNFKYLINLTFIKYQETIFKVVGREDDYVICKDGTRVTRIDFIENGEHIKACQWIQEEDGKVEIRIVPDKGFTEKDRLYVVRETERKVGQGNLDINTIIVSIDKLIYTRRGKFKLIVRK